MSLTSTQFWASSVLAVALAASVTACGGGGSASSASPTTPTSTSPPTSTTSGTIAATITITAAGVAPTSVRIQPGERVRIVNEDARSHNIVSDPHPEHDDCPPVNNIGLLAPGATGISSEFMEAKACGFHDHDDSTNATMRGTILIGGAETPTGPGYIR